MITTIGVSLMLQALILFASNFANNVPFPSLVPNQRWAVFGSPVEITLKNVLLWASALVLMVILDYFVRRTWLGKAMRATAQDPEAARMMGIRIDVIILVTFFIGSALAGAAALIFGMYYGLTSYIVGYLAGLRAFTAAVLGGIGNIPGAVVGGILMGLIEALGAGYVGDWTNVCVLDKFLPGFHDVCVNAPESSLFGSNYKDVYAFIVLILVLVFRPQGLLGERVGDRA
jgi:branched-chain amino acid transport system permease protein